MTSFQEVEDYLDSCRAGMGMRRVSSPEVRKLGHQAGQMFWKAKQMLQKARSTQGEELVTVPPDKPQSKNGKRKPRV